MRTVGCMTPHTNVVTYFIITLIIIIYQMQFYSHTCLCCPQDQEESLIRFKELLTQEIKEPRPYAVVKLNDDHGIQTWSNSSVSNCCTWPKVICSSSNIVTHLHLDSLIDVTHNSTSSYDDDWYLNSDILIPLFNITTLTSLDVSSNLLGGAFPTHQLANILTSRSLVSLKLDYNMFQGSFPNEFYHLRKLQHLGMSGNFFNGTLSDQLGGLRNLEFLDISDNLMHGEIAGIGLGNLTNLSYLDISGNSFSGSIPTEIGKLTKMRELDMGWNQFSGLIPIEIGSLTKMRKLDIGSNQFSGLIPTEIGNLTQIHELDLGSNQFFGRFPNSLLKLHNLDSLNLENNSFSSSIPPNIGHNLSQLYKLYLADNHFIGGIPGFLPGLAILDISTNMLSGSLPSRLFNSSLLSYLYLSNNNLRGTIPNTIGRAVHLHHLQLSNNSFSSFVPQSLSKTKIYYLDLSNNDLSGDGDKFPFLSDIIRINLSSNRFSGPLPLSSFGSSIEWVFLGKNEYSGVLINKLQGQLRRFDIHDNNISGEIPSTLFNSSYLEVLILRNNSFHGSIQLFNNNDQFPFKYLPLMVLDLSYNQLTGTIPLDLGNLSHIINDHLSTPGTTIGFKDKSFGFLVDWKSSERSLFQDDYSNGYTLLDLSNNQLSGTIPYTISNLKYLKSLNFSNNCLSGPIPLTFGELQNIEVLDLSHSNLSGQIPYTFSKLYQITTLDLSNNNLSGRIPDSRQLDTFDGTEVYANNSGLCGKQIGVSCPGDEQQPKDQSNDDNKDDNDKLLHAWEGAVIGFAIACIGTMGMLYVSGYFIVSLHDKRKLCSKLSPCIVCN